MRRRAEAQCAQQMAEERLSIFGPDAKRFEHFLLQFRLMNTHAPPANLDTVENGVGALTANFTKPLRSESQDSCCRRPGQLVVHSVAFVLFRASLPDLD